MYVCQGERTAVCTNTSHVRKLPLHVHLKSCWFKLLLPARVFKTRNETMRDTGV